MIQIATQKWRTRAACAGYRYFTEASVFEQQMVCEDCPVKLECLKFALQTEALTSSKDASEWPVYGGVPGDVRQKMIRRLGKNRGRE